MQLAHRLDKGRHSRIPCGGSGRRLLSVRSADEIRVRSKRSARTTSSPVSPSRGLALEPVDTRPIEASPASGTLEFRVVVAGDAIYFRPETLMRNIGSGKAPSSSTASWNRRMSNLLPCRACRSARSFSISCAPIRYAVACAGIIM
jgi:hypothetical protein